MRKLEVEEKLKWEIEQLENSEWENKKISKRERVKIIIRKELEKINKVKIKI